ncbi:S8/S53 family peptidase [Rhodovulum sp. YNF3179]|uniref:S8/S53 family peptidase n=1 Tax=Rhodovulum sp. YNF3179 TaxID=3425127 RepID=UPI003D34F8DB
MTCTATSLVTIMSICTSWAQGGVDETWWMTGRDLGFADAVQTLPPLETYKPPAWAGGPGGGDEDDGGGGGGSTDPTIPTYYGWMSPGLEGAWTFEGNSYLGQGATITVVDDFSSRDKIRANLGDGKDRLRHGEWTLKQAGMVAPKATMVEDDFYNGSAITLTDGFDILNLSYGYTAPLDRELEFSIVEAAREGTALIAKSAGNNKGSEVGYNGGEVYDYLSLALINDLEAVTFGENGEYINFDPVIFAGAMDWNMVGTGDPDSAIAYYSSVAGSDPRVQRQFLVVGVEAASNAYSFGTGLAGTSFAAPVIAGYGAVLSSKFQDTATPTLVAKRLLETAHSNFSGYNIAVHGQGEADILAAIAPDALD